MVLIEKALHRATRSIHKEPRSDSINFFSVWLCVFFVSLCAMFLSERTLAQPGWGSDSLYRQTVCDTLKTFIRRGDIEVPARVSHIAEIASDDSTNYHAIISTYFPDVLITSPATRRYNCHGMTFDSSRNQVDGNIDAYLRRNGYKPLSQCTPSTPRKGDIVIYRDPAGRITHSATVDTVTATDTLVVSKWGEMPDVKHKIRDVPNNGMVTIGGKTYRLVRYGTPEIYRKC